MCGLTACWGRGRPLAKLLVDAIRPRGPDYQGSVNDDSSSHIFIAAAVLHIQGDSLEKQPAVALPSVRLDSDVKEKDAEASGVLCWNGEVFGGPLSVPPGSSDTAAILTMLNSCQPQCSVTEGGKDLVAKLASIWGPYAFAYWSIDRRDFYFGRDPFGRRSLVGVYINDELVAIASSAPNLHSMHELISSRFPHESVVTVKEVPIDGVYKMTYLSDESIWSVPEVIPWPRDRLKLGRISRASEPIIAPIGLDQSSRTFLQVLKRAIGRRVAALGASCLVGQHCRVGILFSGGIDSVLIAAVLHVCLEEAGYGSAAAIDLVNVAFDDPSNRPVEDASLHDSRHRLSVMSPDRLAAVAAVLELQFLFPHRQWRMIHVDVSPEERQQYECHVRDLIAPCDTAMDLNIGTAFWFASRAQGQLRTYDPSDLATVYGVEVDGRPLLRIGDEGAARATGRLAKTATVAAVDIEGEIAPVKVSCRTEGCRRYSKLGCPSNACKKCCCAIAARVAVDGGSYACKAHRVKATVVNQLTVDSDCGGGLEASKLCEDAASNDHISCGDDRIIGETVEHDYVSDCKALLIGIGADEQLAGYGRHRTTFVKCGLPALEAELNMDMERLWKRNLGRDDRCISDNGRESWLPYLDEELVSFLQSLPMADICDLDDEQGRGDKQILREAAKLLGLGQCTQLVKRAIQFGTRIAKHTNILYHGSHRKGSGSAKL